MSHNVDRLNGVSAFGVPRVAKARPRTSMLASILRCVGISRERATLRDLTDRELADIGLTRDAANAEAGRPFWDLPAGRR